MNKKTNNVKPILFISDNFPPVIGGSSTVYDQICKNNRENIVALSSCFNAKNIEKQGHANYDDKCGYLIYRIKYLRVPNIKSGRLVSMVHEVKVMLSISLKMIDLCLRHEVKVICVGELIYGGWIVLFSRYILRKKTIIYTHGEEISQVSDGLYNKYRGVFLQAADRIISVSLFCKSQIVSLYHIDPDKVDIISNGVDTVRFCVGERQHELLAKHTIQKTDKVILCVGRLVKRKGQYNLILAMRVILQQHDKVKLIIIGSGEEEQILKQLVVDNNLQHAVIFLTAIDDVELIHYYQSADIFSMPNITLEDGDTEGFGLVFLEANACAKPVVGGQAGGAIEAIIHNKTGLLVDGYKVDDIAQSILRIINDDTLHKRLSIDAYDFAQHATWKQRSYQFSEVMTTIQETRRNRPISHFSGTVSASLERKSSQKRLHITVDFEEMFDWLDLEKSEASVEGITEIEIFHQRCLEHKIQPCYLVTHKILQSDNAVNFLKSIQVGSHNIGIHLHSWNSPPYIEQVNSFNSYQCNLPNYLEQLKLEQLINIFEYKLGFKPLIHRAGRYGCTQQTLNNLKNKGIKIDLSPSSGYDFSKQGGPDFSNLGNHAFWSDEEKSLLCLPVPSIDFWKGPDNLTKLLSDYLQEDTLLRHCVSLLLPKTPVRLSPEANDLNRMKLVGTLLDKQGINDFVLSVHSTSLYTGGNEYALTQENTKKNITTIIDYVKWSNSELNTETSGFINTFNNYL